MNTRYLILITTLCFLSACASTKTRETGELNRQSIDDALEQAAAVEIPEAEVPSSEVLDDLVPESGINVPGLEQDIQQEAAFDISVSNAPARLFFMSLVKDTSVNMVVHPSV
ncbi:MAG: hypothetical protein AAF353_19355, partial [Pseudomonadota bacterium]